ncbi:phosphatidate cytidylyltransferase [Aquabacterium sp. CECT 9606]|uniref:phosphatidate cytidylyltransferase n=1 Tax=Aquabacterium sp. CECT 9606 TaxID=2845822 RepID=UPI001E5BDD2A|nr:phosphatidate cytidylyltransferase [Aquabacterium sp. CECT 9606]CAH0353534.1 Phosphatidate cytidylyltransferase [Aquabacterium sp. CECT 9606]
MLKQRVITALILMAILLPSLAAQALWPFAALGLLFVSAAGWEWARLNGWPGLRAVALGAGVAVLGYVVAEAVHLDPWGLSSAPHAESAAAAHVHVPGQALAGFVVPAAVWWVSGALWALGGALALRWGTRYWKQSPTVLRALLGLGILVVAWLALTESKAQGLNFLLSIFCLVWAADIGAYFGGRAFGRRKLAISISPGKSWEGVWSGMLSVLLLAVAWIAVDRHWSVDSPSMYSHLLSGLGPVGLVLSIVFLVGMSVVGDLFESLIKRQAGAKDSSQLLPGHGGVLDRIDALLPVLPLVLALMSLCHG